MPRGCNYPCKKVYCFDFTGSLCKEYKTVNDAAEDMGMSVAYVYSVIRRGSTIKSSFYLSYSNVFKKPKIKKYNRNPLFRKHAGIPHY